MFIERGEKYQIYHVQFAKGVVGLNADVVRAEVSLYLYISIVRADVYFSIYISISIVFIYTAMGLL